jgi:hypothetical protein
MPLYPLCNHGQDLPDAVAHAAAIIRRGELDSYRRADLLITLAIFGRLRDRSGDEAAQEFEEALNRLTNLEQLRHLHKIAIPKG